MVVLGVLLIVGRVPHPLAIAALLHIAADFTFQSAETAAQKGKRDRHLLVHALAAGGLPLAVAGWTSGDPIAVVLWAALGTASHYAVDWTRKFGLRRLAVAVTLDQACHLTLAVTLVLLGSSVSLPAP